MIDIVLASYNGEKFIKEQLESIVNSNDFNQLVNKIIISDDHSNDNTEKVIATVKCPKKLELYKNLGSKGVISNFSNGLSLSTAKYIMLCDQDDVWVPNKIRASYNAILKMEKEHGENHPCLHFTDLKIVDKHLNVIAESFFKRMKLKPEHSSNFKKLAFQNVAPGCAMIFNRKLLKIALPIPSNSSMHDWWLMLCANSFGHISYSEKPSILYRQHEINVVGASERSSIMKMKLLLTENNNNFENTLNQLIEFKHRYNHQLCNKSKHFLLGCKNLKNMSLMQRIKFILSENIKTDSVFGTLVFRFRFLKY